MNVLDKRNNDGDENYSHNYNRSSFSAAKWKAGRWWRWKCDCEEQIKFFILWCGIYESGGSKKEVEEWSTYW